MRVSAMQSGEAAFLEEHLQRMEFLKMVYGSALSSGVSSMLSSSSSSSSDLSSTRDFASYTLVSQWDDAEEKRRGALANWWRKSR